MSTKEDSVGVREDRPEGDGEAVRVFPHVLIRLARLRFSDLRLLDLQSNSRDNHLASRHSADLAEHSAALSAAIHDLLPLVPNRDLRAELLKIRRDAHNLRAISTTKLRVVATILPKEVMAELAAYRASLELLRKTEQDAETRFELECLRISEALLELSRNPSFRRGLAFSSHSLFRDLERHEGAPRPARRLPRSLEQGLLKYLSRAHAKTSPFSTFTSVGVARLAPVEIDGDAFRCQECPQPSSFDAPTVVRLNSGLCTYLLELLTLHPAIAPALTLELNRTIRVAEDEARVYRFLSNQGRISVVQRLECAAVVDHIWRYLAGRSVSVEELRSVLCELTDSQPEEATAFIRKLVDFGFLVFVFPVSPLDPLWPSKLHGFLCELAVHAAPAESLRCMVSSLCDTSALLPHAPPAACVEMLSAAWQQVLSGCRTFLLDAGIAVGDSPGLAAETLTPAPAADDNASFSYRRSLAFRFRPQDLFLDDSTFASSEVALPRRFLAKLAGTLHALYEIIGMFSGELDERSRMAFFLQTVHQGRSVPFLDFFEGYCRTVLLPRRRQTFGKEGAGQRQLTTIDEEIPAVRERHMRRGHWLQGLRRMVAEQEGLQEVRLSVASLAALAAQTALFPADRARGSSQAAFLQVFNDREATASPAAPRCVLNGQWQGFGRAFSRFLHLLDPTVTDDLRKWNLARGAACLLVENTDSLEHNANVHPWLMPYELLTPQGYLGAADSPDRWLSLADLVVALAPCKREVELRHQPTGKEVFVFDLGFAALNSRSPMFQTLQAFSLCDGLTTGPLLRAISESARAGGGERGIVRVPRVILEDEIVLQRAMWVVDPAHAPRPPADRRGSGYFREMREWGERCGLPSECFVSRIDGAASRQRPRRQDYKPQYVSFNSPPFVELLGELMGRAGSPATLTEVLPNNRGDQGWFRGHVSELVLQWFAEDFSS